MAAALSRFRALEQGSQPALARQPARAQFASRVALSRAAAGKGSRQAPAALASSTSDEQQQGHTASEQQPRKLRQKPVVPRLPLADLRQWDGQRAAPGAQAAQAASAVGSSDPKLAQRSSRARPEDGTLPQDQAQGESWAALYESRQLSTQSNCNGSAHGGSALLATCSGHTSGHTQVLQSGRVWERILSAQITSFAGGRPHQAGVAGAQGRLRPASAESGTAARNQAAPAAASSTTGRSHRGSAAASSTAAAGDPLRQVEKDSNLSESSSNSPMSSPDRSLAEVDSRLRLEPGQAAAGCEGPAPRPAARRQQIGATQTAVPPVRKSREQVLHEQVIQELHQHHHMQHPVTPVPGPAAMQDTADGLALDRPPAGMSFLQTAGFLREASHTPASPGARAAARHTRWR